MHEIVVFLINDISNAGSHWKGVYCEAIDVFYLLLRAGQRYKLFWGLFVIFGGGDAGETSS